MAGRELEQLSSLSNYIQLSDDGKEELVDLISKRIVDEPQGCITAIAELLNGTDRKQYRKMANIAGLESRSTAQELLGRVIMAGIMSNSVHAIESKVYKTVINTDLCTPQNLAFISLSAEIFVKESERAIANTPLKARLDI